MGSRKLPDGVRVYENDRFKIPDGWSKLSDRMYEKNDGAYRLTVERGQTHDSWKFTASRTAVEATGEASSRLAAMRKAELHAYLTIKRETGGYE